jgi:hypothetical protein
VVKAVGRVSLVHSHLDPSAPPNRNRVEACSDGQDTTLCGHYQVVWMMLPFDRLVPM